MIHVSIHCISTAHSYHMDMDISYTGNANTHLSKAFHVQFSACALIHTVICRTTDRIYGPLTKLTVNKVCQLASKPEKNGCFNLFPHWSRRYIYMIGTSYHCA